VNAEARSGAGAVEPHRIALLHYSPIRATVEGEPCEIIPWLGTSRLEEPIDRYPVNAVVHGHAHNGSLDGETLGKIPVHNVALPLWRRSHPNRPFKVLSVAEPIGTLPEARSEKT
jgi:hypothetical protein